MMTRSGQQTAPWSRRWEHLSKSQFSSKRNREDTDPRVALHSAVTQHSVVRGREAHAAGGTNTADSPAMAKGYNYVLSCTQPDGGIYRKPELVTYNTALSMLALL